MRGQEPRGQWVREQVEVCTRASAVRLGPGTDKTGI